MIFEKKQIEIGIGNLPYYEIGSGDPLVSLHPAGGPRLSIPLEGLAKQHQVLAPICPGWESTILVPEIRSIPALAELLAEFIEETSDDRVDLMGMSLGGWVGAWLAILHPELVGRLVLLCPAGIQPDTEDLPKTPEEFRARLYAHPEKLRPQDMPRSTPAQTLEAVAHYTPDRPPFDADLVERLDEIQAPTLVVYGRLDRIIPEATPILLEERIANAGVLYVDDAAHALDVDQPETVLKAINEFLDDDEAYLEELSIA
jgi:pimeloyl-ACP methyl ester carboxylesterase